MPTPMMAPPRIGKLLYLRLPRRYLAGHIEVTVTPSIIGVSISPLKVGDAPCTVCW